MHYINDTVFDYCSAVSMNIKILRGESNVQNVSIMAAGLAIWGMGSHVCAFMPSRSVIVTYLRGLCLKIMLLAFLVETRSVWHIKYQ